MPKFADADKTNVGEIVNDMREQANAIINGATGIGKSGECPFASAYEVHLFYQFCICTLALWHGHTLKENDEADAAFYLQVSCLCEVLSFLDRTAVPLPEEVAKNITFLGQEELFPHWITGEMLKGEEAARRCLAIAKEWHLEKTEVFQNALVKLERNDNVPEFVLSTSGLPGNSSSPRNNSELQDQVITRTFASSTGNADAQNNSEVDALCWKPSATRGVSWDGNALEALLTGDTVFGNNDVTKSVSTTSVSSGNAGDEKQLPA
jgi:hypothetical protein